MTTTTVGDVERAVALYADDNVTFGLVPQRTILAQVLHALTLRRAKPAEMMGWGDEEWRVLFAGAFRSDNLPLRLAILRALAEATAPERRQ